MRPAIGKRITRNVFSGSRSGRVAAALGCAGSSELGGGRRRRARGAVAPSTGEDVGGSDFERYGGGDGIGAVPRRERRTRPANRVLRFRPVLAERQPHVRLCAATQRSCTATRRSWSRSRETATIAAARSTTSHWVSGARGLQRTTWSTAESRANGSRRCRSARATPRRWARASAPGSSTGGTTSYRSAEVSAAPRG